MQKGHAFKPLMRAGLTTLLLGSALAVNAQNAIVKGVVKDTSGEPVIGASVKVKGSNTTGTVTSIDGDFSLNGVQKGQTLVITYIGCDPQEIKWT